MPSQHPPPATAAKVPPGKVLMKKILVPPGATAPLPPAGAKVMKKMVMAVPLPAPTAATTGGGAAASHAPAPVVPRKAPSPPTGGPPRVVQPVPKNNNANNNASQSADLGDALLVAVSRGSSTKVEEILKTAAASTHVSMKKLINSVKGPKGRSLLQICSKEDYRQIAGILVSNGASLESTGEEGWTALHTACCFGNISLAEFLVEKGSKLDAKTKYGETPLHTAARHGRAETCEKLLRRFGIPVDPRSNNQWTPLHSASVNGFGRVVEVLLGAGANVDVQTNNNWTPIHMASANGYSKTVEVLLKMGRARLDIVNKEGKTALQAAKNDAVRLILNPSLLTTTQPSAPPLNQQQQHLVGIRPPAATAGGGGGGGLVPVPNTRPQQQNNKVPPQQNQDNQQDRRLRDQELEIRRLQEQVARTEAEKIAVEAKAKEHSALNRKVVALTAEREKETKRANQAESEKVVQAPDCCICLDSRAEYLVVPCGHHCLCEGCKRHIEGGSKKECPVCKSPYQQIVKVFSS